MELVSEAFYDGAEQTGVLLRDVRSDELATFIAFRVEDGEVYRAEQLTRLGPAATDWASFRFAEAMSGTVTVGVREDGRVCIDGVLLDGDAVPSYLGWRILRDLASNDGERAAFRQLDEHGEHRAREAMFVARIAEEVTLPGADGIVLAQRYDLLLDGRPYTSFWWDGEAVVASDWTGGAMSVLVEDLDTALAACPVTVAGLAREWVAGRRGVAGR